MNSTIETPKRAPGRTTDGSIDTRRKKSDEHVKTKAEKAKAARRLGQKEDELAKAYIENNPKKDKEVYQIPARYLALREISEAHLRTKVFTLLGYARKLVNSDKALLKLYRNCWVGGKFKLEKLLAHFTRDKAKGRLGFYRGTRKIHWDPKHSIGDVFTETDKKKSMKGHDYSTDTGITNTYTVKVTGWWAIDDNEDNINSFNDVGKNFNKDILTKRLAGNGYGDEWLGKDIYKAMPKLRDHLYGKRKPKNPEWRDSSLNAKEEQEILDLTTKIKEDNDLYTEKANKEVFEALKKLNKDKWVKWVQVSKDVLNKMAFLFGIGVSKYLYRYVPSQKKFYYVLIDGQKADPDLKAGGYIKIKKGALVKPHAVEASGIKVFIKKKLIEKMKPAALDAEVSEYRIKIKETPEDDEKEILTKDYLKKHWNKKTCKWEDIQEKFYDPLHKKVKHHFEKSKQYKFESGKAEILADYVIEKARKAVDKYMTDNPNLKDRLDGKKETKVKISFNDKNEATVESLSPAMRADIAKDEAAIGEVEIVGAKSMKTDLMAEMKKKNPIKFLILNLFFKFEKKLDDILSEKNKSTLKWIGLLGFGSIIAAYKLRMGARKMNQETFDKLLKKKRKKISIKSKFYFTEKVNLKAKKLKIVIPKGKGIAPGGNMDVLLDKQADTVHKIKGKKGGGLLGLLGGLFGGMGKLFGRGKKEKPDEAAVKTDGGYGYVDREITILNSVSAGTIIPRGAKIMRTS